MTVKSKDPPTAIAGGERYCFVDHVNMLEIYETVARYSLSTQDCVLPVVLTHSNSMVANSVSRADVNDVVKI